ncbi:MAG TPA: HAD-IA family hydrolase [Fermentimonas sp.]|nr:HAD-IA family hydrolase [Fermentimonas sp.]
MNNYDTYIFDFDYTLADSSKGIIYCFNHVLEKHGFNNISEERIKRTIGMTLQNSFKVLTGENDMDKIFAYVKEYVKTADGCMTDNTVLFPETTEVLETLKENGVKLGIVSTKYRYRIKEVLDREFECNLIDVIVGGEDVTTHKPSPEGLLLAIDKLNSNKNRCLYIGDSTIDAETAQAAGVDFYGVLNGATTRDELSKYPNIMIAKDLNNLLAICNQTVNI